MRSLRWALFIFPLFFFVLGSFRADSTKDQNERMRFMAEQEIRPFLLSIESLKQRSLASEASDPQKISVDRPGQTQLQLPTFALTLGSIESIAAREVAALRLYLGEHREVLGVQSSIFFHLKYLQQKQLGSKLYVQFQQQTRRTRNSKNLIPIQGATLIAIFANGKLVRITSKLMTPPSLDSTLQNSGIRFEFTKTEMARFMGLIKRSEEATGNLRNFLTVVAGRVSLPLNFEAFLNRQVLDQKEALNLLLEKLGKSETASFLLSFEQTSQLSYVQYGTKWMLQVTGFLNLPIQFDIEVGSDLVQKLAIRNFREIFHKVAPIRSFQSPSFPGGKKIEGGESAKKALHRMQQISQYFAENYGWTSYNGKGSEQEISIHTQLRSIDFRENAAWIGSLQKFLVGEGGSSLYHFDDSLSILGHEYTHAILQFSSGLTYRGQSGAINEHFADLQGSTLSAILEHEGVYDFTIGRDILRPELRAEKEKLLDLIFAQKNYGPALIKSFALDHIGLRHLYAPALSYATQYDHVRTARDIYPYDCQPSVDNDNCGVHSVSGVPNKAAALIIAILGLQETRAMFFNTVVYRLTQNSDLEDYVVQLNEECLNTPAIAARCDVILASFAAVGVEHPKFSGLHKNEESKITRGPPIVPLPQSVLPIPHGSSSPILKMCGWVEKGDDDSFRIFDDKFNTRLVSRNYEVETSGDFQELRKLDCACVSGFVTQISDEQSLTQNVFVKVTDVQDRQDACARDPRLGNTRSLTPAPVARSKADLAKVHNYCGWVSVNAKSKNVTIIDNRYDPAILVSGYDPLTLGHDRTVNRLQCACIKGRLGLAANSKGTVFNFFTQIEPRGVTARPVDTCAGLEWK